MGRLIAVGLGLVAIAAVKDQLGRPAESRTWHGRIAGVPYDFRPPSMERARAKVWDETNPSLLAPTLFGIGWSINLYRLAHPLSGPQEF
jgi:hypothetical protein